MQTVMHNVNMEILQITCEQLVEGKRRLEDNGLCENLKVMLIDG